MENILNQAIIQDEILAGMKYLKINIAFMYDYIEKLMYDAKIL